MKSYIGGIPQALTESAKIDGAGDFTIFVKIILPLIKPALATVGLLIALGYWNDWYNSMLFINNENLYSLQYYLYKIVNNIEAYKTILAQNTSSVSGAIEMPSESLKMALISNCYRTNNTSLSIYSKVLCKWCNNWSCKGLIKQ